MAIFDGINQLPHEFQDLRWLPSTLPPHVHIILSSLPDSRIVNVAKKRNMIQLLVPPLDEHEKQELVSMRLCSYGKSLTKENLVCTL